MSVPNLVLLIATAVTGFHCGTAVVPEPPSEAAVIELRFDETVAYRDLKLRWLRLDDSRCPTGVTCVWEGQIVAIVEVARGAEGPVELELRLRVGIEPETSRAFDHELVLREVAPHPRDGVTPERSDYLARIEIVDP